MMRQVLGRFIRGTGVVWRVMVVLLTVVLGASAGSSGVLPASAAADGWTSECVHCPKYFGSVQNRTLQLDSQGHAHIAYAGDYLYYAWYDGSDWDYETVAECRPENIDYVSMVLDASDQPRISYVGVDGALRFAFKDAGIWQSEAVGDGDQNGNATSLALDSEGEPHISWLGYVGLNLRYAHKDADGWHVEIVDSSSDAGWTTSLALDGDDYPHISYHHQGDNSLKYARWDGSSWIIETVDSSGGARSSLALDAVGNPQISYQVGGNLMYAFWDGSGWNTQAVGAGEGSSLVVGASGTSHISYNDNTSGELKYAYRDTTGWQVETAHMYYQGVTTLALDLNGDPHIGAIQVGGRLNHVSHGESGWQVETVDSSAYAGMGPSLAMDGEDYAHMTYNGSLGVQYAYQDAGGWHLETVAWGGESSLALDGVGDPHVSYAVTRWSSETGPYWEVMYASRDVAGWQFEVVANDMAYDAPPPPSLAIDGTGSPHIGFWNQNDGELKYAYREGDVWQVETADASGGSEIFLALDGDGFPHLSYVRSGTLFYAYRDVSGWDIESVDSAGYFRYTSLTLDGEGYPHISYYDSTVDDLRYAYRDASGWNLETVDAEGDVGQRSSLAVDEGGYPHISYYDCTFTGYPSFEYRLDLKYAHWNGTAWQITVVDSDGDVGQYSSLALDSAGVPHIGYYDASHQDLKYAYFSSDELQVPVDVKPHSCPNVLNVKVQGSLPVAILGTESFDISQVDPASVRLEGVAPLTWSVADVATPYVPFVGKEEPTDCTDAGPDGFLDLKLKFAVPELVAALGEVADGDAVVVHLIGNLKDEFGGTPFVGEDVILILKRGKP